MLDNSSAGYWNIGYPSKIHNKLKSYEVLFTHN